MLACTAQNGAVHVWQFRWVSMQRAWSDKMCYRTLVSFRSPRKSTTAHERGCCRAHTAVHAQTNSHVQISSHCISNTPRVACQFSFFVGVVTNERTLSVASTRRQEHKQLPFFLNSFNCCVFSTTTTTKKNDVVMKCESRSAMMMSFISLLACNFARTYVASQW